MAKEHYAQRAKKLNEDGLTGLARRPFQTMNSCLASGCNAAKGSPMTLRLSDRRLSIRLENVLDPDAKWPGGIEGEEVMKNESSVATRGLLRLIIGAGMRMPAPMQFDRDSQHCWLRNTPTLYGVESAALALSLEGQSMGE